MMKYALTYYHNGVKHGNNWVYGCSVSRKTFGTKEEAVKFIEANSQFTPAKLLEKDDEFPEMWNTVIDFRK